MTYARIPRTVRLIDGLSGTAAAALGEHAVAEREPNGFGVIAGACWISFTTNGNPVGAGTGTITWTIYGSNDGATWMDTGAVVAGVPTANTVIQTAYTADDAGGSRYFARVTLNFFRFVQVRASNVAVTGANTHVVTMTDCREVA